MSNTERAPNENTNTEKAIDTTLALQYNKKSKLIGKTFPTYSESQGSNANELAMRWSRRADIESGNRTAIFYKDKCYLIAKFDDSDYGYQIVKELSEQGYEQYLEERKNDGQEQSVQEEVREVTSFDKQRNTLVRGKLDSAVGQHRQRRENNEIREVGGEQAQSRQTGSKRDGDSNGGGKNPRGDNLKYSLKPTDYQHTLDNIDSFKAEERFC